MIQVNELRVGNFIEANGPMMEVKSTTEHSVELYLHGSEADNWEEDLENCNGIPITPEILEKCGFKHGMVEGVTRLRDADDNSQDEGDTHYWDLRVPTNDKVEGLNTFSLVKFGEDGITFSNQWLRVKLSSLHQLQNLYFALTGEELNYTP